MSSNFHIVMKNSSNSGGKAQNRAQNELKFSYGDEDQQKYLCVCMLFCIG